ncbi:MAG: BREX-2 system adenine-specific DNA-methyltransferase PglX [Candidatus Competibacteraceae bacterium]
MALSLIRYETLSSQAFPIMIDRGKLLAGLKPLVRTLEADLRARFESHADYRARLEADWQAARDAGRTAEALETWAEGQFTQSAVAWILACVFVRFCEDNALLEAPLIAGADRRGQSAVARQEAFYLKQPLASDNEYLRDVFATAARLPGLADVFKVQRALLEAPVSADVAKQLVRFFRATDADSGALVHDFMDTAWNTRFLGDLYQDLSEAARERYALLQTPEFIESFILDRTLTPALDSYTLEEVDIIDPTCGSGHFLLGAFERLAPRWLRYRPDNANLALQEALDRIAGIDLNPFAVAIARFRLLIAALKLADVDKLRLAPNFHLHIETGDSLLHGFDQRDYTRAQAALALESPQENLNAGDHLYRHAFAAEDLEATNAILVHKYAVVVGNPPYITVKDRAVSALYRERYESCHRTYALVAPFCERFWALAKPLDNTQRAGFIGLIVANLFMKREFGKKLVEDFFPKVDLTTIIDTSGAYIPGHGTPTVILFGRARQPTSGQVRAVMGIKGEPATPAEPAQGIVWQAMLSQIDQRDSESEWISVTDMARAMLARHPWTMGGGGATELRELIENSAHKLSELTTEIGRTTVVGEDEIWIEPIDFFRRLQLISFIPLVIGENVRDWSLNATPAVLYPYESIDGAPLRILPVTVFRYLWSFRRLLEMRTIFGKSISDAGKNWYEHLERYTAKLHTPLTITFAFVATHNHFTLDRGGKVFNRSAPVIKLSNSASENDHLGLMGLLNSSLACFWLKQVCFPKDRKGGWDERSEHDVAKIRQLPVVTQRPTTLAKRLDQLATERASWLPSALLSRSVPTVAELNQARQKAESLRAQMIAWQEELDWQVYQYYGVLDEALCYNGEPPEVKFGERAFEILLAQDCAAGKTTTTWFERHNAQPIATIPDHWPADYRDLIEKRMAAIRHSRDLALIERPECKRRWAGPTWESLERAALENWLLDRLEAEDLWPRDAHPAPRLQSVRELVNALADDENFRRALDLFAGSGIDAYSVIVALVQQAAVPYLDALRYSDSGLRKRAIWQHTWELQRREDAIDAEVARQLAGESPERIADEQKRRKAAEVGTIPAPPKYRQEDFRDGIYWKLRGALDVPKERFVGFPRLGNTRDSSSFMLLWAGYDAKARALALMGYLYGLQQREGMDPTRIAPALAGLDQLLPWVHQWHPEIDDDLGMTTGDYLQGLLDTQLAQHGLTLAEVRAWQPPAPVRRRRR